MTKSLEHGFVQHGSWVSRVLKRGQLEEVHVANFSGVCSSMCSILPKTNRQ